MVGGISNELVLYIFPFWKCWHIKVFRRKLLLFTLGQQALPCIIHRTINILYTRFVHFPITKINTLSDVGVCGPIIFGINFFITAFKLRLQAKLLGKWIVEALRPKSSCLLFMVIPRLTIFMNLISLKSRRFVACHKMGINTLIIYLSIKVKVP